MSILTLFGSEEKLSNEYDDFSIFPHGCNAAVIDKLAYPLDNFLLCTFMRIRIRCLHLKMGTLNSHGSPSINLYKPLSPICIYLQDLAKYTLFIALSSQSIYISLYIFVEDLIWTHSLYVMGVVQNFGTSPLNSRWLTLSRALLIISLNFCGCFDKFGCIITYR